MARQLCHEHQPEVAFAAAPGDPDNLLKSVRRLLDALIGEEFVGFLDENIHRDQRLGISPAPFVRLISKS